MSPFLEFPVFNNGLKSSQVSVNIRKAELHVKREEDNASGNHSRRLLPEPGIFLDIFHPPHIVLYEKRYAFRPGILDY